MNVDKTPLQLARKAMAKQNHRGAVSMIGPRIFKAIYYAKRYASSLLTKIFFSLIWKFEGSVTFLGPIYARAVSGEVVVGANVLFGPFVTLDCAANARLRIGKGTTVNQGTFIVALESIHIGEYVSIGEYCSIRDNDHNWADATAPIRAQGYVSKPVIIEDDVWIGRGVLIGKGVRIGRGAVIAGNAVIVKDVEPFTVVGGIPGRVLKRRA